MSFGRIDAVRFLLEQEFAKRLVKNPKGRVAAADQKFRALGEHIIRRILGEAGDADNLRAREAVAQRDDNEAEHRPKDVVPQARVRCEHPADVLLVHTFEADG